MSYNFFSTLLKRHGHPFRVEHDGVVVNELDGLENHDSATNRPYIGFMPDSDIAVGDWLINGQNQRYYVADVETRYIDKKAISLECFYRTGSEKSQEETNSSVIFNIGSATGSIIGTQGQAALTYNTVPIDQLRSKAEAEGGADKEDLQKIISLLERLVDEQIQPSKGLFSKFSAIMERHSWITSALASACITWLTSAPR